MKYGLSEKQLDEIIGLIGSYPEVEEAVLFGSRAIDTFKAASDVDIALKGEKVNATLAAKLQYDFEEDTYLPFFFDFIAYPTIDNQALREHIDTKGISIYRKGWRECKLGDLLNKVIDNRGKNPPYTEAGYEVIETSCISGNNKFPDYSLVKRYVDEYTYKTWFRGHPEKGDILIITVGNGIGSVAIMNNNRGVITQNLIALHFLNNETESNFYYYFLNQESIQDFLRSMNIGSAQPSLKVPHLLGVEVPVPPLPEQKAIASVLSSLDDKIDLLHRQNKTLEAMAEILFKQWFVVEAREDWEEVKVGNFVITNEKTINNIYSQHFIQYLDTSSLTDGKIESVQLLSLTEAPSRAKRLVKHNDVLISTVRPNQKHFGIIKNPEPNLVVSTGFCVLHCHKIDPHFIYILLTTDEMTEYLHSIAEGSTSTYPSLKPSDIEKIEFSLPPQSKLDGFAKIASDNWNKIAINHNQIRTLEKLRDNLLPKLMSGEVRVVV